MYGLEKDLVLVFKRVVRLRPSDDSSSSQIKRITVARTTKAKHKMAPPPGPYSGTSTLALVARVSAFSLGLVYGNIKLKYLKAKAKSQKKAEAKAHH